MAIELTDAIIRELPAPDRGYRITYDSKVRGLGLRITAAGARSYIFNYRVRGNGDERRYTIGDAGRWTHEKWTAGVWTLKKARERAGDLRREVDAEGDPQGDLSTQRAAPTVNDLADRFEREHLPKKRPGTQDEYKRLLKSHIRPALGTKKVADLRHADIDDMHRAIRRVAPYSANRAVAVTSKMLSLSIKWEMRETNPAVGIEKAPETKRERYLTPAEITRLSTALAASDERQSANAVRLLLLTGARKGETLTAKWTDIDLVAGVWTKPAATTKTAKLHRVPLSAPAWALLVEMKAEANKENERRQREKLPAIDFVFPSRDAKGKIVALKDVKHFWATVAKQAGLGRTVEKCDAAGKPIKGKDGNPIEVFEPNARIHDLRHSFASILASAGLSLPIIGRLLGHTQAATTQRYAHLMDDPLRAATERVGAIVGGSREPAKLLQFKGKN